MHYVEIEMNQKSRFNIEFTVSLPTDMTAPVPNINVWPWSFRMGLIWRRIGGLFLHVMYEFTWRAAAVIGVLT